jgi:protein involved in polysaccharide export with SLBB domain
VVALLAAQAPALAQSSGYGDLDSQQLPQTTGQSGAPGGASGAAAQQPAAGAAAGAAQAAASSASITPFQLTTPSNQPLEDQGQGQGKGTRPDIDSGAAGPYYVRPGATPGQFELLRSPPPLVSEFETYVENTIGKRLPRYGSSLLLTRGRGFATSPTATVPPDYQLNPGDELIVDVTGSVEANLRLVIDPEGRVFIPRVGPVSLAGVRYGDLTAALTRRFEEQFKKVNLSVVIGRLHGLNIYVTGYAVTPGAYTVSSLSTMVDAVLAAGGPAAGGSFRTIELRRNGQLVTTLDLYDLLLNGDKSHDVMLQNEDVLNIAPVGPEVAVTGSVNAEAIYEAKPGETLGDMIRDAGGASSLADDSRVMMLRLGDLDKNGWRQLPYASVATFPAERGDILRVITVADISHPRERQAILATIEGEVDHPGKYYLQPGSSIGDLLAQAGGMTTGAFVFGSELDRDSVRRQQQASFDRAIGNLELAAAAAPLQDQNGTADRAAAGAARGQAALAIIDRLKTRKPDGRLVMPIAYGATTLPTALVLENNDRLLIPPRPQTVGVFGAVYQPGSFVFNEPSRLGAYLKLAGGPQKIADKGDIFVVRANGSVMSRQQVHDFDDRPALPGDVVFVPVRTTRTAWEKLIDAATLIYGFGIGVLTLKALGA